MSFSTDPGCVGDLALTSSVVNSLWNEPGALFFFFFSFLFCRGRLYVSAELGSKRVTGSGSYWAKKVKRRMYCGGPKDGNSETVRQKKYIFFRNYGPGKH